MRSTFLYTLLAFAVASIAVPSGIEPAGELQPKLIPKVEKRQVTAIDGLKSREIGGGFIAVLPKDSSEPVEGDDGTAKRRGRFLRKDEVVVPDTLQEPSSKRALYCKNSGYGLCPSRTYCCPLGGLCCFDGGCCKKGQRCCKFDGCCPSTHNCVIVSGQEGCCPIGKTCTASSGNGCVDAGYVPCNNYNFCCKPGYTCYRDSLGTPLCRAPGSDNNYDLTTTKRTTTTTSTTPAVYNPTTFKIPDYTTTTTSAPAFAFPTTTPGNLPANTTSSASRSASSVDIPLTANTNGATSSGVGYSVLMTAVLFALSNVLVVA